MLPLHDSILDILADDLVSELADAVLYLLFVEVCHYGQRFLDFLLLIVPFHVNLDFSAEELSCNLGGVVVCDLAEEVTLRQCLDA